MLFTIRTNTTLCHLSLLRATACFTGFGDQLNDLEYFEGDRTNLEEKAVFGEIAYEITENWDVTFGARFYEYEYETANLTEFPYFSGPEFRPFPLSEIEGQLTLTPNQSFEDELFKVNTSYTFENGNLLYATFSQGFRVGASNGGESCPDVFVAGNQGFMSIVAWSTIWAKRW